MSDISLPIDKTLGTLSWKTIGESGPEDRTVHGEWRFERVSMDNSVHAFCDDQRIMVTDIDLAIISWEPDPKMEVETRPNSNLKGLRGTGGNQFYDLPMTDEEFLHAIRLGLKDLRSWAFGGGTHELDHAAITVDTVRVGDRVSITVMGDLKKIGEVDE